MELPVGLLEEMAAVITDEEHARRRAQSRARAARHH